MEHSEELNFDTVEHSGYEATYEEVAKFFRGPMSKHPVISVKGHPEVIWVRPDLGIGSVSCSISFAVGSPPRQIPWREVERALMHGYLPIIESTWRCGPLLFSQTSFAALVGTRKVRSGHEKQVAFVEITVSNIDSTEDLSENVWVFVPGAVAANGIPPFPYNTYDLFEIVGVLPAIEGGPETPRNQILRDGSRTMGRFETDESIVPRVYNHALQFLVTLRPRERKTIRLMVTSSARGLTKEELAVLRKMDYQSTLASRILDLEEILKSGTQIEVPDATVNNIFKAQILHCQSQILQAADKDYCLPIQGYQGVWPWEAMKLTTHLDSIGYHEDVRRCLEYFLRIQGRFPPHGDFKNNDAVFGGTIAFEECGWEGDSDSTLYGQLAAIHAGKEREFPNWMNGTGAMLHAFGTHFWYTRDHAWLERVAPALIRACDWILTERQSTMKRDADERKVLQFGLLPVGRAYDTAEEAVKRLMADKELPSGQMDDRHAPLDTYYPCFTDSYSSQGLTCISRALREIGHPDGARLVQEAQAYREDVLEVMKQTRSTDPDSPPYPERLYRPPAWAEFATGALAYVDSGFMEARSPDFEQLEGYMKQKWNRGVLGLTGAMEKNGDPHGSESFYVNFSEDIWHRGWLLRGESEKAILAFYSMLSYGMDRQTLTTVERFHLHDPRYAPFCMDTSASARVCGLIRQTALMEENDVLYLLAGAPRRWLEAGRQITVRRGVTKFAKLDLSVKSDVDGGNISLDLTLSELYPGELKSLRIRVPHPRREWMKCVLVNGSSWSNFDPRTEVINLAPLAGHTQIVVLY